MRPVVKLSLCMATYNRGDFIAETIESVLPQLTDEVELVIVDGNSPDETEAVVRAYTDRHPRIRYYREPVNSGIDADYDRAVGYAVGDYCWLMPDDDLLAPNAVERVMRALEEAPDLVLVDGVVKDVTLTTTLKERRLAFSGEKRYSAADADQFLVDASALVSFIGATIIRRDRWMARDRQSYYGSLFVHVGVIFQQPLLDAVIVIGEPLMIIRLGNSMWTSRRFEIWAFKWPDLIWSFPGYSDRARAESCPRAPWRTWKLLLSFRAKGAYSYEVYRRLLASREVGWWRLIMLLAAVAPGRLMHVLGTSYMTLTGEISGIGGYELLHCSPYANRVSRAIASLRRRRTRLQSTASL